MAMFRPFLAFRPLVALLLLLGVMLGGAVDAIACEPETEFAESATLVVSDNAHAGDHQLPKGDHDGVCVHGHCHHGASHLPPMAVLTVLPAYHADHPLPREHRLASLVPDTLKRPPRA